MTREKAQFKLKVLEQFLIGKPFSDHEDCEALDMAIEALQFVEHFDLLKEFQSLQEVVRCNNCKHRYMDGDVTHYYWCRLHDRPVDDTDYCSWGEESEEEG